MAQRILRPLGHGELLDELFDLYKSHFLLFAGISGLVQIPLTTLTTLIMLPMYKMMGSAGPGSHPPDPTVVFGTMIPMMFGMFGLSMIGMVAQLVSMAATTWAVSSCYLGGKPTILESYKAVLTRLVPFILTAIILYFALGLGFLLCFLPGLFVLVVTSFVSEVLILERKDYFDAIKRSYQLAASDWGRILVIGLLIVVMITVVSMVISVPSQIITAIFPKTAGLAMAISSLLQGIVGTITTPLWVIVFVLLYYDIRVRREGFDVEMLAASIGRAPAPPPSTNQQ